MKAALYARVSSEEQAVKPQHDFEPLFKMNWEECSEIMQWRPRGDLNTNAISRCRTLPSDCNCASQAAAQGEDTIAFTH